MAKPLANGYPIGAIMIRSELAGYITVGSLLSFSFLTSVTELVNQVPMGQPLEDHP